MNTSYWGSFCCESDRDRRACRSWFGEIIPDDWGLPVVAQGLEDANTGAMKKVRALFRRADGALRQATRTTGGRNFSIKLSHPQPSFMTEGCVRRWLARGSAEGVAAVIPDAVPGMNP